MCHRPHTHRCLQSTTQHRRLLEDTPAKGEARCPPGLRRADQDSLQPPGGPAGGAKERSGENFRTRPKYGREGLGPTPDPPPWGGHSLPTNHLQPALGPVPRPRRPRLPAGRGGWQRLSSCWARRAGPLGRQWCFLRVPGRADTQPHTGSQGPGDRLAMRALLGTKGPSGCAHTLQAALQLVPSG